MKSLAPTLTALVLGALVLAATHGGANTAVPATPLPTTVPTPAANHISAPDWDFLAAIRASGMDFTGDWEQDLASAGVDLAQVDTFQLRAQVCGTAMDDGEGDYHPASQTHGFWLSSFYDEVRRMGRDHGWGAPRIVAYHHCPSRFAAVDAVRDLEARAKSP
jgi:hypothetical protein